MANACVFFSPRSYPNYRMPWTKPTGASLSQSKDHAEYFSLLRSARHPKIFMDPNEESRLVEQNCDKFAFLHQRLLPQFRTERRKFLLLLSFSKQQLKVLILINFHILFTRLWQMRFALLKPPVGGSCLSVVSTSSLHIGTQKLLEVTTWNQGHFPITFSTDNI